MISAGVPRHEILQDNFYSKAFNLKTERSCQSLNDSFSIYSKLGPLGSVLFQTNNFDSEWHRNFNGHTQNIF